tara:strand:+ start:142 stop:717 length:576 start_codon:yes stop_codon:yes gene_type:complete
MRAFLSLDLENIEIKKEIEKIQYELSKIKTKIKLVETSNLHFTLKFFPHIEFEDINKIIRIVDNLHLEEIEIKYNKIGVFPNYNKISVIWIGIDQESTNQISNIYNLINNKLKDSDIQKDQRFVPHLTIARVKNCEDKKYIQKVIEKYKNIIFGQEKINKIKLKKSILTSNGPVYSNLYVLNMNGGENERT